LEVLETPRDGAVRSLGTGSAPTVARSMAGHEIFGMPNISGGRLKMCGLPQISQRERMGCEATKGTNLRQSSRFSELRRVRIRNSISPPSQQRKAAGPHRICWKPCDRD